MQHSAARQIPLVLVPGLNGDPRIFSQQSAVFPTSTVLTWIAPQRTEGLRPYAERLANSLELHGPCIIAGVSFGGIMALEMARHLDARSCIVIASSRDAAGLPWFVRLLRPLAAIVPQPIVTNAVVACWSTAGAAIPDVRRRTHRLSPEQRRFQQWALRALFTWRPKSPAPCPILQIHGDRDKQFPGGVSWADRVIRGAGHLLTLTHSDEINEILADAIRASAA